MILTLSAVLILINRYPNNIIDELFYKKLYIIFALKISIKSTHLVHQLEESTWYPMKK